MVQTDDKYNFSKIIKNTKAFVSGKKDKQGENGQMKKREQKRREMYERKERN